MSLSLETLEAVRERLAEFSASPQRMETLLANPRGALTAVFGEAAVGDMSDAELAEVAARIKEVSDRDREDAELDERHLEQVVGGGMSFRPGKFFSQFWHGFVTAFANGEGLIGAFKAGTEKIGKDAPYAEPFLKS